MYILAHLSEEIPKSTCFETSLSLLSLHSRDWVPVRKFQRKKYIIIYYITKSTLTPRHRMPLTVRRGPTLREAMWSRTQEKQSGNMSGALCEFLVG